MYIYCDCTDCGRWRWTGKCYVEEYNTVVIKRVTKL